METKTKKAYKQNKLGTIGRAVKYFVKEAGVIENEIVAFNINWPLKLL